MSHTSSEGWVGKGTREDCGCCVAATSSLATREFCQRCQRLSPVGFHAPNDVWRTVAGRWQHSILCLACFAELGDEKFIKWEVGLEFYPVSFVTHREFVAPEASA